MIAARPWVIIPNGGRMSFPTYGKDRAESQPSEGRPYEKKGRRWDLSPRPEVSAELSSSATASDANQATLQRPRIQTGLRRLYLDPDAAGRVSDHGFSQSAVTAPET